MSDKKVRKGLFKVLTGVIVGGAVGSILGLTLAPKKGKDTRKAIREKSLDMFLKGKEELKKEQEMGRFKKVIVKILTPRKKKVKQ
ncbi:MAG: YtxH domain-containing protein [Candidatus Peregrinibacteria bacterium]|nr:YtxH domain-containing protein [Candidatus Peregrinibacteria bacterium]